MQVVELEKVVGVLRRLEFLGRIEGDVNLVIHMLEERAEETE